MTVNGGNLNPTMTATSGLETCRTSTGDGGGYVQHLRRRVDRRQHRRRRWGRHSELLRTPAPIKFNLQATYRSADFVGFGTGVGGLLNVETLEGSSSGNDTLVGFNGANTFNITGTNAGTVNRDRQCDSSHACQFSDFENLNGPESERCLHLRQRCGSDRKNQRWHGHRHDGFHRLHDRGFDQFANENVLGGFGRTICRDREVHRLRPPTRRR